MIEVRTWPGQFAGSGIFSGVPADVYHGDPCPEPSLSSSVLNVLIEESPSHAAHRHPRLNERRVPDAPGRDMQVGSVLHKLALGVGADIVVINAENYRTKDAQAQRDTALGNGKLPILAHEFKVAEALAHPMRQAIEAHLGCSVDECLREVVVFWEEGGFWRRAMIDCITPDLMRLVDVKSTGKTANPRKLERHVFDMGYHRQAAFYTRGVDALDPSNVGRREFAFIFAEQGAPHVQSPPILLSESAAQLAREQVDLGCQLWDEALATNCWRGYGTRPVHVTPPPWVLSDWEARAIDEGERHVRRGHTAEEVYGKPEEAHA